MAQDAELKLKVSLDLAFFRQQLTGLGQAAAGYNMPINVKLDRSAITKELRNLERAIGKKKINVELNLLGGLTKDQLEKIQGRLEALSKTKKVEIPVSVKNGATGRDIQDAITGIRQRIAASQQIRQGNGKIRIPTSIKPSITNADVSEFKKAVQQKLSGISVKVKAEVERGFAAGPTGAAGLFEYMRSQGLSGGNVPQATEVGRSERLKKALNDLTVKQLQALAKEQGIGGVSKMRKDPLIEKLVAELNQDIAENILGNIKNQLRDVGKGPLKNVLDTFARGLFNMLGMDAASMRRQMAERRALPPVSFPATVPPRSFSIGPSSTGRALPPGVIPSALPGTAFAGQRYLPSALGEEMKRVLREAANAFLDTIRAGIRQVSVRDMGPSISRQPLLGAGRIAGFLPGRPSQASMLELNNILAGAVRTYLQAVAREIVQAPKVPISRQPLIGASRIAGLLPAGVGREPSRYATGAIGGETREQMMARRTAEAYARSALRGMDVMGGGAGRPPSTYSYAYRSARPTSAIVPYAAGGAMVPAPSMAGGGGAVPPSGGGGGRGGFGGVGGFGGLGGFGHAMGGINLPGAGTIRELGSEFAFATKQVLLFGQAYKMLGFLQDFPGQVGQAVAQLQTFRNTLGAVSTSAEDAAESNQMILDLVDKYNVPLQSARDGFTKLYASMAPAGFSGDEIRDLFTGITQAAATFGMSADKVDRVNYAFAQMASKGQVMSEELKGQLGDVLPGAMALFAEAAGFEGPKAIQEFSAALEDGVYKGEAMNVLLKNVGIVMKQEFGPGAEGAARTFQGVINRMQNSMQLLYESFEPVAIGFLNSVVMPLTDGIKTVSDGFTAFFSGSAAKTAGGGLLAQELNSLRPVLEGIRQNVSELINQFGQFARVGLELGKVLLQIAGNPFIGYMLRVYANVLVLTTAIQLLNLQALIPMIANLARSAYALIAFTAQCVKAGQSLQVMGLMARTAGTTLRTFFASTGVGLVLVGLGMLIERIMTLNQKMDETRQKASAAGSAIRMMSGTEAIAAERTYAGHAKSLEGLNQQLQEGQLKGKAWIAVNRQQSEALKAAGVIPSEVRGQAQVQPFRIAGAYQRLEQLRAEAAYRKRQLDFEEEQARQARAPLAAIPSVVDEEKAGKGKSKGGRKSLDQLVSSQILMLAEAEKAAIKLSLAQTKALAPDTTQAQRILDFYAKFRNNLVDIQAIEGQIAAAERNRSKWIKDYGITGEEIDRNLAELRNQLKIATIDLAATEQDYRNQAKADAAEEAAEMEEKLRRQKELNRLIEDAQIAAGIISPQQAAIIQQQRGFEDARARVQAEGTPEQLSQLLSAQALIPEAGSIQETIKTLRDELDKLTSSQEMVRFSALSIGEAFSTSFKDAITGASSAQEALAGFFQSVANSFADMAAQMINKWLQMQLLGLAQSLLPGIGSFAGGAKIGQAVNMPTGVGIGAGGGILQNAGGQGFGTFGPNFGIRQFANGGLVTGPTMGLIGEGRYNEAVVPLPDGKTIPVDLGGASTGSPVSVVVNVDAKGTDVQGSDQRGNELGRAISSAVQQELIKQQRPGGLLAGRR